MTAEDFDDYEIKIEDDVAMPPSEKNRASKYPVRSLKVGQSFFTPAPDARKIPGLRNTISHLARTMKPTRIFIESRIVHETIKGKKVQGLRVWRVADRHTDVERSHRAGKK